MPSLEVEKERREEDNDDDDTWCEFCGIVFFLEEGG
jgi:hypothetical protein